MKVLTLWVWFANWRWMEEIRTWEWLPVVTLPLEEMEIVRNNWRRKGFCTALAKDHRRQP